MKFIKNSIIFNNKSPNNNVNPFQIHYAQLLENSLVYDSESWRSVQADTIINSTVDGIATSGGKNSFVQNSIIYNNGSQTVFPLIDTIYLDYSLVFGDSTMNINNPPSGLINWGNENIYDVPQYADPTNGDYTLVPG